MHAFDRPWAVRLAVILVAATLAAPAQAQPPAARLLPAQSEIAFTTRQMGVPVEGHFGRFSATVAFDPKQPAQGSVVITIDTGSARFGSPELDAEIGRPEWLDVGRYGQARFQSSAIHAAGPGRFDVSGQLSLKGVVHAMVVPVQLVQNGSSGVASGSFTLKRLDYKVGEGEWTDTSMLADDVLVKFKLALAGLPAP
ncbi:MAG: YceI family protein [Burkholderiales bacterium]|nr:YceI family protein [Burkholderiales bacterium]